MKNIYLVVFLIFLLGCIKKKQEDMVVNAMVNGQWKVTNFKIDALDVTTDFATYKFQFKTNLPILPMLSIHWFY